MISFAIYESKTKTTQHLILLFLLILLFFFLLFLFSSVSQGVQFKLADMATELTASRLMVHRAASLLDAKAPEATMHCAMAKRFATDMCSKIANDALQLHGGYGYLNDFPLEKIVRDLRVHQILEGANDVMRVIIGRQVTKD